MADIFIAPDKQNPADWRVEDVNADGDGSCAITIFSGFEAGVRARAYADWLRSWTDVHNAEPTL
jgi:hypothetical protein